MVICPVRVLTDLLSTGQRTSQPYITVRLHLFGVSFLFYFITASFYILYFYIYFISLLICLETEEECAFHPLIRQCSLHVSEQLKIPVNIAA